MNRTLIRQFIVATVLGTGLALLAGVIQQDAAFAQAVDRYSQGIKRKPAQPVVLSPRSDPNISTDETQLVSALNGIVIVDNPARVSTRGASAVGVESDSATIPQQVSRAALSYIGKPVSLASLDRLTRDMVLAFRDADMPIVNVVVPPQDITNGVLQIVAVVGRLGRVTVEGNPSNPEYYIQDFALSPGDVISENQVLDHIRWKSRRSSRRVNAIYSPGSKFSETDLAFDVKENKPWSIFFGADNTGSKDSVGEYRFFSGFTIAELLGNEDELSFQYTTSENGSDALSAYVLSYIFPVANRTDFQFTGAYVKTKVDGTVSSEGESTQLGGTFITQLPRWGGWSDDLLYGFEYKKSDNNLEFGGVPVTDNVTEIGQFFLQLTGQHSEAKSRTNFYMGAWISPGGMFDRNTNAAFAGSRTDAVAHYTYFRAGLDHMVFLPADFRLSLEGDFQTTTARLLPSELMYIGGLNTVRGFDENTLKGDTGGIARFELISPGYSVIGDKGNGQDSLRLFSFFDIGQVSNNGPVSAATDQNGTLGGAGIGFTYQIGNNLSAEVAYGWSVIDSASVADDAHNGRLHFRVVGRF